LNRLIKAEKQWARTSGFSAGGYRAHSVRLRFEEASQLVNPILISLHLPFADNAQKPLNCR
jgi:hypothetical protein